jgi:hypothetical protein
MGQQASFIDGIFVMAKFDQKTTNLAICVVLFAVSYALRAIGADFGLINYDERINDSARFLTGDLIPSQHFYPPFINYVVGVALVGLYGFGWVVDMWSNTAEFRQAYFTDATPFYLTARYVTAATGAVAAPLSYACARVVGLRTPAAIAVGCFAAVLPLNVFMAHIAKGDTGLAVFCLAVVWGFLYRIKAEKPSRWDVGIGLLTAIALSFKHSAVLVLGPLAVAMIVVLANREGIRAALGSFSVSLLVILAAWPVLNIGVLLDLQGFIDFQKIQAVMSIREEEAFGAGLTMTAALFGDLMFGLNPVVFCFVLVAPVWLWSRSCRLDLRDALQGTWIALVVSTVGISLIVGTRQPPHLFQANVTVLLLLATLVMLDMLRVYVGAAKAVIAAASTVGLLLMIVSSVDVVRQALAKPVAEDVVELLQEEFADKKIQSSYALPIPRTVEAQRVQLDRWNRLAAKYDIQMPEISKERLITENTEDALFWVPAPFVMFGLEADDVLQSEYPVRPHAWPIQPDEWHLDTWLEDGYRIFVANGLDRMIKNLRSSYMRDFYRDMKQRCQKVRYFEVRKPLFDEYDVTVFDCSDA